MNFKIVDDYGNQVDCNLLYTFKGKNDINYIIYTDGSKNNDGKLEILASRYVVVNKNYVLKDIESDAEWDLIDKFLEMQMK